MVQDQLEGAAQQVVGKVQDAVGAITGDADVQAEGKMRQAFGNLQQSYEQTVDHVRVAVANQPIQGVGVLVAAAVGFVLGALWNRDR
ncbi:hypothetical protein BHUM_01330 [Candidatus Burkholderia humilis]|nr:hypothetical protein BHUM_01330 [Candidatus Burkholderia humilis]